MEIVAVKINVSESIGSVSAEIIEAEKTEHVMVMAHGAGANMHHRFMKELAYALAKDGVTTIRFNFPFTENKKGRPDPAPIAERTIEAAIEYAREKYPNANLFAGGKSFGGRMSSQLISRRADLNVKGLIFFGFPLHPAGKPSMDRAKHLASITIPMLFIQGTRDALADMILLTDVLQGLPTSTLTVIDGADHGFLVGKKEQILPVAEAAVGWISKLF